MAFPITLQGSGRIDSGCTDISDVGGGIHNQLQFDNHHTVLFLTLSTQAINKAIHNTLCPSWQELPKSTILMALLLGLHSRMFSGFRSQWMMLSSGVARNRSAVHNCWANFRVRFKETPLKFVFRNKSYRLYDNISNTKQR